MADTIVTNSPATNDSGTAAWVMALVVVFVLVVGTIILYQRGAFRAATPAPASGTNINVTVPNPAPAAPAASGGTQ